MRMVIVGLLAASFTLIAGPVSARAKSGEVRLAPTRVLGILPLVVKQREKLIEKQAEAAILPGMKAT